MRNRALKPRSRTVLTLAFLNAAVACVWLGCAYDADEGTYRSRTTRTVDTPEERTTTTTTREKTVEDYPR